MLSQLDKAENSILSCLPLFYRRVTTSTIARDNNDHSSLDAAPVTFAKVQFEPKRIPGAGIMGAGLLVKEFITPSKIDPDSHMKRLSAAFSANATENAI